MQVDLLEVVRRKVQLAHPQLVRIESLELRGASEHLVDRLVAVAEEVDAHLPQRGQLEPEVAVVRHVLHAEALERGRELLREHDALEGHVDQLQLLQIGHVPLERGHEVLIVAAAARRDGQHPHVGGQRIDFRLQIRSGRQRDGGWVDAAQIGRRKLLARVQARVAPLGALDLGLARSKAVRPVRPRRHDVIPLPARFAAIRRTHVLRAAHHAELLAQVHRVRHAALGSGRTGLAAACAREEGANQPGHVVPDLACEHTRRTFAVLRFLEVCTLDCDRLSARRELDAEAPGGTHEGHHGAAAPVQIGSTLEVLERDFCPDF